jgi:hypothetical protein
MIPRVDKLTILPRIHAPSLAEPLDLEMLLLTGGQERTEGQHQALFQAAGL